MKKAFAQIEHFLEGVKADRRLEAAGTCFLVAHQLSRRTNGNEFRKTGQLVTWQSVPTLAAAVGKSQATVRRATGSLKTCGHLLIKTGRGPGQSNRYTLIPQKRQPVAGTGGQIPLTSERNYEANTAHQRAQSKTEMRSFGDPNALIPAPECAHQCAPNSSITNSITCARAREEPNRETEDANRGPRLRAVALGPLASLEPEVRKWLVTAKLVAITGDTVTLSVLTPTDADNAHKYCEAAILDATGASRLEFIVEIAADPPKARRRP